MELPHVPGQSDDVVPDDDPFTSVVSTSDDEDTVSVVNTIDIPVNERDEQHRCVSFHVEMVDVPPTPSNDKAESTVLTLFRKETVSNESTLCQL